MFLWFLMLLPSVVLTGDVINVASKYIVQGALVRDYIY